MPVNPTAVPPLNPASALRRDEKRNGALRQNALEIFLNISQNTNY
jgi:hypothetical protein